MDDVENMLREKLDIKGYIWYDSVDNEMFAIGKFVETESRLVVARVLGSEWRVNT